VDYDGSSTNFDSSMNYSLQEYANDIVWALKVTCEEAQIPEPTIVTESGRALVAHHAVLVAEVVGRTTLQVTELAAADPENDHDVVLRMSEVNESVTAKNYQESYHDALHLREEVLLLFNTGGLSLPQRARAEEFFFRVCSKIMKITRSLDYVPDDLEHLQRDLADTYFVNFSVFQSIPDSWAIQQLFPVMPIHRLSEEPTRHVVLADLTCDSDGKVDRFIDLRDVKRTLELHTMRADERYFIAFFLVGAYQEILGDMHNLFGDTNVVHVDVDEQGKPKLANVLRGDRVKDVLGYVEYFEDEVLRNLRRHVEESLELNRMSYEESALFWRRYEAALRGYTYLTRREGKRPAQSETTGAERGDRTEVKS
jgi:arginine decarboxylase